MVFVVDPTKVRLSAPGPLLEAVNQNRAELVEQILRRYQRCGGDNRRHHNDFLQDLHRAFWYATAQEKFHLSRLLLLRGSADPNTRCISGSSVLHLALEAAFGSTRQEAVEVAEMLLELGADPNVRDRNGRTCLTLAILTHQYDTVRLLLEKGAKVDGKDYDGDQEEETPLFLAAGYGRNPFCAGRNHILDIVRELLRHGAERTVNKRCTKWLETPLHRACRWGLPEVVSLLLTRGADPNIENAYQETPLHVSLSRQSLDIASTLLCHGADPDSLDCHGRPPLDIAVGGGVMRCEWAVATVVELVRVLLRHGANPNLPQCHALHVAAAKGNLHPVLCVLMSYGANIQALDQQNRTPLDCACQQQQQQQQQQQGNSDPALVGNTYELVHAMVGNGCISSTHECRVNDEREGHSAICRLN